MEANEEECLGKRSSRLAEGATEECCVFLSLWYLFFLQRAPCTNVPAVLRGIA
jgi:hypothetical protein